jgi:hypothetical protein
MALAFCEADAQSSYVFPNALSEKHCNIRRNMVNIQLPMNEYWKWWGNSMHIAAIEGAIEGARHTVSE